MNYISIKEEKLIDKRKQKIMYIVGFFVISIIGTLLHFTFDFSGKNLFIAPFSAVNESVWEHLKIAVIPIILWTFIEFVSLKFRSDNLWISLLVKILTVMGLIILLYYINIYNTWLNIAIFYFSILISQILGYKIVTSKKVNVKYEEISKYIVIAIFLMFIIFTFIPPKLSIFKDEVTSTYGVFEFKY